MSIIGTCGHELDDVYQIKTIAVKEYSKEGSKAIGYPSLCTDCILKYYEMNLILETKKDKEDWIGIKLEDE